MPLIRPACASDAEEASRIYDHHVSETIVTFEETPIGAGEMARRIQDVTARGLPWLVAEEGGLVGYACAVPWKPRFGYRFSVETSIYLATAAQGRGVGTKLYGELVALLRRDGLHVALGGIALPNAASVALHEKLGFRKVAHLHEVGLKFGRWIDVGYWELELSGAPCAPPA